VTDGDAENKARPDAPVRAVALYDFEVCLDAVFAYIISHDVWCNDLGSRPGRHESDAE
jgi:hypothetical protein